MYTEQLNNYAAEPNLYFATSPSLTAQRQYALQGSFTTLLVTALFLLSCAAS